MVEQPDEGKAGGRIGRVEDMQVFRQLYQLSLAVEKQTRTFPADFRWLRNQALRSSESACANITEGFYSQYSTEYLQALFRSRREARETTTHLRYAADVGCLEAAAVADMLSEYEEGLRQLNAVIASVERKIQSRGKGRPGQARIEEQVADYNATDLINH